MAVSPFLGALLNAQQMNQQQEAQSSTDDARQQQLGLQQAMQALQNNEFMQRVKEYQDAQPERQADVAYKTALTNKANQPPEDPNAWTLDHQNKMYTDFISKGMAPVQALDATMAAKAMSGMTPEAYAHAKAAGAARDMAQAIGTQGPQAGLMAAAGGAMMPGPFGMLGMAAQAAQGAGAQVPVVQQQQAGMIHAPVIPGVDPASLMNVGEGQAAKIARDQAATQRYADLTKIGQENAETNWQKMLNQQERYKTLDDLAVAKTSYVQEQLKQLPLDASAKRNMENNLATYRTGMLQLGKDKLAFEGRKETDANAINWAKLGAQRANQIGQIFSKAWTGLDGDAKELQGKLVELDRSMKDPMFLQMATGYTDPNGKPVPANPVFKARFDAMQQHQQQIQQALVGVGAMRDESQARAMQAGTVQLGTPTGNPNAAATNKAIQQLQNGFKRKSLPGATGGQPLTADKVTSKYGF